MSLNCFSFFDTHYPFMTVLFFFYMTILNINTKIPLYCVYTDKTAPLANTNECKEELTHEIKQYDHQVPLNDLLDVSFFDDGKYIDGSTRKL